jgi:GR25 family glycosyltransferase involved in LPS biosynthesis
MNKLFHRQYLLWGLLILFLVIVLVFTCLSTTKDKFRLLENDIRYKVPPIYCINLASETKRREHIQDVFGSYVEFVEAIDTRDDKWKEYSHYLSEDGIHQMRRSELTKTRQKHYELTPGAIGCFLSHIKCWNKFLDTYPNDGDFVFILEDDTMPAVTFHKTFANVANAFPPECDLLLCDHLAFGDMEQVEHHGVEYRKLLPHSAFYLLNAYFITARGIKKILHYLFKNDNKFHKQLDSYLSDLSKEEVITVYTLKDNECFQIGISPTSIQTFTI